MPSPKNDSNSDPIFKIGSVFIQVQSDSDQIIGWTDDIEGNVFVPSVFWLWAKKNSWSSDRNLSDFSLNSGQFGEKADLTDWTLSCVFGH